MKKLKLKPGDIISFKNSSIIGVFKKFNKKINDSGDITFKTYCCLINDNLYFCDLIYDASIRYATKKERKNILKKIQKYMLKNNDDIR